MAKIIVSNLNKDQIGTLFEILNPGKVKYLSNMAIPFRHIVTDCNPDSLNYPKGWYYDNGVLTNKGNTTNGTTTKVTMVKKTVDFRLI